MSKSKFLSAALIFLLLVSALDLFGANLVRTVSGSPANRITLPFTTGFENGDPHGRATSANPVDWQTANFVGYGGSGSSPRLDIETASPAPPSNGYNFGSCQLVAEGNFLGPVSYCYFNLFDQTSQSDWGPPIMLQNHTYISVWYCHTTTARCAMIDGLLYNQRTGQWWTLRDFTPDGTHFIVDQNNVRIHPAARRYDSVGTWNYSCFDLSMIYNNDPGNWFITKIWVGMDNDNRFNTDGGPVRTGPARTYFDLLQITYGESATNTVTLYDYGNPGATGQMFASMVANSWALAPPGSGYEYDLYLKASFISNCTGLDFPKWSSVNVTNLPLAAPYPAKKPTVNGLNLDNSQTDSTPPYKDWTMFGFDALMLALSAPTLGASDEALLLVQAGALAVQLVGLLYNPSKPTYTYQWPHVEDSNPNCISSMTAGQVYLEVPIATSGTIPLSIDFRTEFWYVYWDEGDMEWHWKKDNTVPVHLDIAWTTPDVNTNPASGSPSVDFSQMSFGDSTLKHFGNPSGNDCNMQITINGQWPGALLSPGRTVSVRYWGNIWASPGSPSNYMVAVLGTGNTPLDTASPMQPGVYPGQNYDRTFSFTTPSSGVYYLYGMAAATISIDQAKQFYTSYPSSRFWVGYFTVSSSADYRFPTLYLHVPTFTISAGISPPPCYLLSPQSINGQTYYAYSDLTDASGNHVPNTMRGMTLTQPVSQSQGTGGIFACSYDLSTLPMNAYYFANVYAVGTNDQPTTLTGVWVYQYNNAPYTPAPLSGPTPQYVNTYYTLSTRTTDPDGDNINYTYDWGDGNTWASGWVASGTVVSPSHAWTQTGPYTISVKTQDIYGLWSSPTTLAVTIVAGSIDAHYICLYGSDDTQNLTTLVPQYGYMINITFTWYDVRTSNVTLSAKIHDVTNQLVYYSAIQWSSTGPGTQTVAMSLCLPTSAKTGTGTLQITLTNGWSGTTNYAVPSCSNINIVSSPDAPNTPSFTSYCTSGQPNVTYTYAASATDADGNNLRYKFDWGDGSTTMTGWIAPGTAASATHGWGAAGTYYVKVAAEDPYGVWSNWSNPITMTVTSPYVTLTISVPQAPAQGTDTDGTPREPVSIWVDGVQYQLFANTKISISLTAGPHTVQAQYSFDKEEYKPGYYYIYTFMYWNDGVTSNPRTINITSNLTLVADYLRSKYAIV